MTTDELTSHDPSSMFRALVFSQHQHVKPTVSSRRAPWERSTHDQKFSKAVTVV